MVVIDARPTQNEHRHRGIGRYVGGLLEALARSTAEPIAALVHADRPLSAWLQGRPMYASRRPHSLSYHLGWLTDELLLPIAARRGRWRLFHATDPDAIPDPRLVRTVVTVYDLTPYHDRRIWDGLTPDQRLGYRRMLGKVRLAASVITISEATRRDIAAALGVPIDRIHVVYPWIRVADWAVVAADDVHDRSGVLFVGAPGGNKNLDVLIRALAAVPQQPVLTVTGPWSGRHLEALTNLASDSAVKLVVEPHVPEARLKHLYRSSSVLVLPSRHEGFGLPVLEAMASGCPVIVSDAPALREVVGGAARVVPVDDTHALAGVITDVLADPAEQARLSDLGLARAADFGWESSAKTLLDLYDRVLHGSF